MKNEMWHLYYSGIDGVDANKEWLSKNNGTTICSTCGNYFPNENTCLDLVVDQRIPKKADMFTIGCLSPVIISEKIRSILGNYANNFLNFGKIYLNGERIPLATHFVFTGKSPWVLLRGDKPSIFDGEPLINPPDTVCEECGAKFGHGRGTHYILGSEFKLTEIAWTEFGGLLVSSDVMARFKGVPLKSTRVERVEIR